MYWARVTTLTESIWNWPSRLATAVTSRDATARSGRRTPNPWAARATRRAAARLIPKLSADDTLTTLTLPPVDSFVPQDTSNPALSSRMTP